MIFRHRTPFVLLISVISLCFIGKITGEETAKSFPVIKSGCTNYPPFCIIDKNGNADGFSVELLRLALQKMNRNVEFRTGPWTEIQTNLEKGEIQALPIVGRTPEREKKFDFTFPYLSRRGVLVVRESTKDINGTCDLNNKDVAVMKDGSIEEFLNRNTIGCRIHTTPTYVDALVGLSSGKYDAVVIQHLLAAKIIQDSGLRNLRILEKPIDELQQDFCFAVKEGDKKMLSILNEGLALVMADGTFARLEAKWFSGLQRLSGKKTVIAVEEGLPPYSFIAKNGNVAGFNVDITRAIAQASGLDIEIVCLPCKAVRKAFQSGLIDAVGGVSYTEDRDSIVDFSAPFAVRSFSAFHHTDKPDVKTQDDLRGKKLLCISGSLMNDYIVKYHLTDRFTAVQNESAMMRMFDSGKYDYALASKLSGLYWIRQMNLKNIKLTSTALITSNYCFAVNDGNTELLQKINEGLAIIKQSGEYKQIYDRWLGALEPNKSIVSVLKEAAMVLLPLLFIMVCVIIWSWMLKRQVEHRTAELNKEILQHKKTEEELRQSEIKWKTLFTTIPVGVALVDKHGEIIDSNNYLYSALGYSETNVRTEAWKKRKFYRPDGTEMSLDDLPSLRAIKEQRIIKGEEIGIRLENGEVVWAETSVAPVNLPGISCVMSGLDITIRKKAEENLKKISERLSLAASSAQLGIWDWNKEDNSITLDDRVIELYEIKRDDLPVPVDFWKSNLHSEDKQRVMDEISLAVKGEKEFHTVFRVIHSDGTVLHIRADAIIIRDLNGKLVRITGIVRDITESIKTEDALQKTQKLESLGVLAGGIAHDFNNILGGIYGCFEIAKGCEDHKKTSEYLDKALGSIDRARGLTQQLLTFAKGGAPVKKIEKISLFIKETALFALSGSNVSCEFEIADELWMCEFDKNQIGQVVDNLVINAKQAMSGGGKIIISANNIVINKKHAILSEGKYVKISVKDYGPGIPKEIQSRIFDPFFTTKSEGHGLGLSTCYSIINRHGGSIDIESQKGKGTTFHFYLPAAPESNVNEIECQQIVHLGTGTIIVMDDEEVMLDVMSEMLKFMGYSTICMRDGVEVIEYLKSCGDEEIKKIKGIILDITIPGGVGGKEIVGEIFKINSRVPVFASSGYGDDPVIADPVSFGFKASICKPFIRTDLGEMLDRNV